MSLAEFLSTMPASATALSAVRPRRPQRFFTADSNALRRRRLSSKPRQPGARAPARWPAGRHGYVERADVIFARARVLQTRPSAPQPPCGGNATRTPLPCPLSDNVSTFRGDSIRGGIAGWLMLAQRMPGIRPRRRCEDRGRRLNSSQWRTPGSALANLQPPSASGGNMYLQRSHRTPGSGAGR